MSSTYVASSTLGSEVGLGLFAARPYSKGECIVEYQGEVLSEKEYSRRYGDKLGKYVLQASRKTYIDARDPDKSNQARFINDCRRCDKKQGACPGNNVRAHVRRGTKRAFIYATRNIAPGEELFWNYGPAYWSGKEK